MGTSTRGGSRNHRDSRSRRFLPSLVRSSFLTSLLLGLAVFGGLWLTVTPDEVGMRWVQFGLGGLAVIGALIGSRLPVLAVIVTAAATACAWILDVTADPFVLTGFAVFRLAEARGARRFPWWMFAGALLVLVASAVFGSEGAEDRLRGMLLSALVLCVAWVLGVRTREAKREAAARSRAEERLRLARDVHDVLSHSLGTIGVQAGVAAHVTTLSTDALRAVLHGIERDARSSLSELKTLLQRERASIDADDVASTPLTPALAGIVRAAEKAGLDVQLETAGALDELPAELRTTVFRIVQESMTNVLRHASASAAVVTIRVASDAVAIRIANDGEGVHGEISPGHGLSGIRERAALLGGMVEFTSSPSGFTVSAELPIRTATVGGRQ